MFLGKHLKLQNKLTPVFRNVPIEETLKPECTDAVHNFSSLLEKVRAPLPYIEIMARNMVSERIFSILPLQILRKVYANFKTTFNLTVLPGLNTQVVLGGYEWKDMTYFVPHLCRLSIGIAVLTYGDKLHLSIQVDKVRISFRYALFNT